MMTVSRGDLVALPLFLVSLVATATQVPNTELQTWDEGIYANVATDVLAGRWAFPHYTGEATAIGTGVFLEKPPLMMWSQAVSMGLFGPSPFAARLPSVVAFAALVAVLYLFARRVWDTQTGAVASLLLLAPAPAHRQHGAMTGATDTMLVLFGTLFVMLCYATAVWDRDRRLLILAGLSIGAAVMTKGPAAAPFVAVVLPLMFVADVSWRDIVSTAVPGAAVALPWHLIAILRYPTEFINEYILEQTVHRATGEFGSSYDALVPFFRAAYLSGAPGYFGPILSVGTVGAGALAAMQWYSGSRPELTTLFCFWWAAFFPPFYGFVGGNHLWYIYPSIAPAALLGAWATRQLGSV
jgi:4-amino-4-deoxy-L-arabinose transferase-like glycosyltransferase